MFKNMFLVKIWKLGCIIITSNTDDYKTTTKIVLRAPTLSQITHTSRSVELLLKLKIKFKNSQNHLKMPGILQTELGQSDLPVTQLLSIIYQTLIQLHSIRFGYCIW